MGKQNFIQGGFKGKVGAVVGAGWKDMLVIKAYTKPANPKTERQKTVRNAFALKVKASQLANQCNYGSSLFSSTSNTSWGLRMAAASSFYAENKNIIQFVPLIPYGYTPDYPTNADPQTTGGTVVLSWDTADDINGRSVNVLMWALNGTSAEYEPVIIAGTVAGSSGAWTVTVSVPAGYSIGEDSYLAAVSSDDASFSDKTLYQPPIKIGTSIVDVPFTLTLASGPTWTSGNDYVLFTFTPSETLSDKVNLTPASSAYGVLQGDFVTKADTAAAQVISNVVTVAVPITLDSLGQRPMFVSGSSLTLGAFAYADDTYRYIFEGATYSLAETATQQTLIPSSTQISNQEGQLVWNVKSNVSASTAVSAGSFSCSSVVLTSLTTETLNFTIAATVVGTTLRITANEAGTIYWGSEQTVTNYVAPVVQINGVNYAISASAPTVMYYRTYFEFFITPENPTQTFSDLTPPGSYATIRVQAPDVPTQELSFSGQWWDSMTITWGSVQVSTSDPTLENHIYSNVGYIDFGMYLSFADETPDLMTLNITNNSEKSFDYTVPNSDSFIFSIVVLPYTATIEM